MAWSH